MECQVSPNIKELFLLIKFGLKSILAIVGGGSSWSNYGQSILHVIFHAIFKKLVSPDIFFLIIPIQKVELRN